MVATHTGTVRIGRRAARPTPEEIDAAILETAAETFARFGFAGTSVQQVADAVGYSKTGLLRRFPSKRALYDAVVDHVAEQVDGLQATAAAAPSEGSGRRTAFVAEVAAAAFASPGVVLLVLEAVRPTTDLPQTERLWTLALGLLMNLTGDLAEPGDRLRALLALKLVTNAALLTIDPDVPVDLPAPEVRALAVEAAVRVMGGAPA